MVTMDLCLEELRSLVPGDRIICSVDNDWWNAVSAIGQWFGAFATLLVSYLALRQGKPQIRVLSRIILKPEMVLDEVGNYVQSGRKCDYLEVKAINIGYVPVGISGIGIKVPKSLSKGKQQLRYFVTLNKILNSHEEINEEFQVELLKNDGIKDLDLGYVLDNLGRLYYERVGLLREIKRQWQWRF